MCATMIPTKAPPITPRGTTPVGTAPLPVEVDTAAVKDALVMVGGRGIAGTGIVDGGDGVGDGDSEDDRCKLAG